MAAPPPSPRLTAQHFQGNANQPRYLFLKADKRRLSDQFAHYRRNEYFDERSRSLIYPNLTIPRQVPPRWPGIQQVPPPPSSDPVGPQWTPQAPPAAIIAARNLTLTNSKRENTRSVAEVLHAAGAGLNFVRLVGWGGQGLAAIFDARPGDDVDADTQHVIVKFLHSTSDSARRSLQREKRFLRDDYARAAHIVQLAKINPPGPLTRAGSRRPRAGADTPLDVLILEYLPRGDLSKFLDAAGPRPDKVTPEPVLWNFFSCLVKGVIGLQHPPHRQRRNLVAHARTRPIISETLPRTTRTSKFVRNEYTTDLVHFDIDPQNVLVGDFDYPNGRGDRHRIAPVLKIADLGYSRSVAQDPDPFQDPGWLNVAARMAGKPGYQAPEQFTEEWDWVNLLPDKNIHTVAGNFGSHTNVFQIGLIMYSAISQFQPPDYGAPHPERFDDIWLGGALQLVSGWTYGEFLDDPEFDNVSYELRYLVKQCLCDDPSHRPHPGYLLARIKSWVEEDWTGHFAPDRMRQWVDSHIANPPPMIARNKDTLLLWIQQQIDVRYLDLDGTPDLWG